MLGSLLQATWPDTRTPALPWLGVGSWFCFLWGISRGISALRKEEGADGIWFECDLQPECPVDERGRLLSPMQIKSDAGFFCSQNLRVETKEKGGLLCGFFCCCLGLVFFVCVFTALAELDAASSQV